MFKMYSTSSEAIEETHNRYDYYYTTIPRRGGEQWWIYTETQNVARDIYPPLFTDPEGDTCFSVYQIRWIKTAFLILFF